MIRIEVSETTANVLQAQAAAQGLTVEAYLERILVSRAGPAGATVRARGGSKRLLDEEATSGHSPSGSFSRAEIYSDHD